MWTPPISSELIIDHFVLLREFDTTQLNPVIWSLIHEMRISIIFPILILVILCNNMVRGFTIVFMIPVIFFLTYVFLLKLFSIDITKFTGGYSSYLLTPHYAPFFMLGSLLAKYRESLSKMYNKLPVFLKYMLFVVGLISYMYVWLILPNNKLMHLFIVNDWMIALGSSIFILFSLNSKKVSRLLLLKPIHFVGKISYSLYLYHLIVITALLYLLHDKFSVGIILTVGFISSFIIASLMYYLIEQPSIKLGKFLSRKKMLKVNQDIDGVKRTEEQFV